MINCGRYWKDNSCCSAKIPILAAKTEQNESYLPCPHCYRAIFVFSADNDYRYLCHVDAACRHGRPFMLLLVIAIERLIHTTYTLTTDDRLLLFYGRFSRSEEISLKDIISVERASSMKIGRFAVMRYVLVKYGTRGKCAVLLPVKEDMFIKTLTNRLNEVKKY